MACVKHLEIVMLYHRVVARLVLYVVVVEDTPYVHLLGGLNKPLAVQAAIIDRTAEVAQHLALDSRGFASGDLIQHALEPLAVELRHVGEEMGASLATIRLVLAGIQDIHVQPLCRQHPGGPLAHTMSGFRAALVEAVHEVGRDLLVIDRLAHIFLLTSIRPATY